MNFRAAALAIGIAGGLGFGGEAPAAAQTSATLVSVSGYGNFHAAGVVATIAGDSDQDAALALAWRRTGAATLGAAQPLVRISTTTFTGSLFGLSPGGNWEAQVTLTDPDGVSGANVADSRFHNPPGAPRRADAADALRRPGGRRRRSGHRRPATRDDPGSRRPGGARDADFDRPGGLPRARRARGLGLGAATDRLSRQRARSDPRRRRRRDRPGGDVDGAGRRRLRPRPRLHHRPCRHRARPAVPLRLARRPAGARRRRPRRLLLRRHDAARPLRRQLLAGRAHDARRPARRGLRPRRPELRRGSRTSSSATTARGTTGRASTCATARIAPCGSAASTRSARRGSG